MADHLSVRGFSQGWRPAGYCGLLVVDIASFCDPRRGDHVRQHVRHALYDLLRTSFARCRISANAYYAEDRGDGVVIAINPAIRTVVLVSSLIDHVCGGLRRHNEVSSEVARMTLRVGIHAGEVDTDDHGLVGTAVNHVFRLTDAPMFKEILSDSMATLAVIASERVYEDVIRHTPDLVNPTEYQPVTVQLKETVAPAWVRLLGRVTPDGSDTCQPVPVRPIARSISSFVGRERELSELHALLTRCRLVTLIGPGGAGKTRLAIEATRFMSTQNSPVCSDGVYVIDLAGYRPGDDLCRALLITLRVATRSFYGPPGRGPTIDALVAALIGRRVLFVLDNCEHLLDSVAVVTETLLTRTETTTLLATSREALTVIGETTFTVNPLALPDEEDAGGDPQQARRYPAVRLFVDRAQSADPHFALTTQNCVDVARICRSLDGLPLPIELAAARVRALTPAQIADRLADRFRLLDRGSRTVGRHRTLQAAMDWSHDLLDEPAKEVFAYLAVFRGAFLMAAVEDLAVRLNLCPSTTVDMVVKLVDKSLLQATPGDDGVMWYRMLETLREYAARQLTDRGQLGKTEQYHAELYVELAERQSPILRSSRQVEAIRTLEREDHNLRAAFEFCCRTNNHELALRLVEALGWYLWMRGDRAFGWRGVARALDIQPRDQDPLRRARALIWSCHLGSVGHRAAELHARTHGRQAKNMLESLGLTGSTDYGYCLFVGAFAAYRDNKHDEGNTLIARGLQLCAKIRDPWLMACTTVVAGIGHAMRGEFSDAEARLTASARHFRSAGDAWGEHRSLIWLSRIHEGLGDLSRAEETAESAIKLVRSLDIGGAVMPLLGWIARLRILRGNETAATSALAAIERNRWWASTSEGIGWITDCQALLAEAKTKARKENRTDGRLIRHAAELYGQAATELAAVDLAVHAVHSRCRQAILLARVGEPTTEILYQATRVANNQADGRARAIILDTMCLLSTDLTSATRLLAHADRRWRRAGARRSPIFIAEIDRLRTILARGNHGS